MNKHNESSSVSLGSIQTIASKCSSTATTTARRPNRHRIAMFHQLSLSPLRLRVSPMLVVHETISLQVACSKLGQSYHLAPLVSTCFFTCLRLPLYLFLQMIHLDGPRNRPSHRNRHSSRNCRSLPLFPASSRNCRSLQNRRGCLRPHPSRRPLQPELRPKPLQPKLPPRWRPLPPQLPPHRLPPRGA